MRYGSASGSLPSSDRSCGYYNLILLHNRKRLNECVSASASASSPLFCQCYKLQLLLNRKRVDDCAYASVSSPLSGMYFLYYTLLLLYYQKRLDKSAFASASSPLLDWSCFVTESESLNALMVRLLVHYLYLTNLVGIIK